MKFLMLPLLLLAAGCMQIDYTGKKFAASEYVKMYRSADEAEPGKYAIIGRFTVKARPQVHSYEVEDAVFDRAVEYGGDAVVPVDSFSGIHGAYNSDAEEFGTFDPADRKIPEKEKELFGTPKPLTGGDIWRGHNVYRFLLLKKSNFFNPVPKN